MDNEDSTSSDIVEVDCENDVNLKNTEMPIIQLFRRLMKSNSKQSTILTNAQIIDILKKEFEIDISVLHELEGDIYLTIMKKFLKDWPEWDEFDKILNHLKFHNKQNEVEKLIDSKYKNIKEYLKKTIDSAQDNVNKIVREVKIKDANKATTSSSDPNSRIILEVQCSRNQLNQLFYRQSNPKQNDTLFNGLFGIPNQIHIVILPLEAILNWWDVKISILSISNVVLYKREIKHELKHILVNRKLPRPAHIPRALEEDVKIKTTNTQRLDMINTDYYINVISKIASNSGDCDEVYEFIKNDLKLLPKKIFPRSEYKRYMNKYPYVRYLYKDVQNVADSNIYDIQLEETMSPLIHTYLGQIHPQSKILLIECEPCSAKFSGPNMIMELKVHFDEQHRDEPDWKCTNCSKTFTMVSLAQSWWCHTC